MSFGRPQHAARFYTLQPLHVSACIAEVLRPERLIHAGKYGRMFPALATIAAAFLALLKQRRTPWPG
jgi:hypothetical protein